MSQNQQQQQQQPQQPAPQQPQQQQPQQPAQQAPARGGGRGGGRGGRGRGRGRGGNPPADGQRVPAPGPAQSVSSPNSPAPTFNGWGAPNVTMQRREVRQTFAVSAFAFQDLVIAEYESMVAKFPRDGVRIPRAAFVYVCSLAWWQRILFLKKENSRLTTNEREAYRLLEGFDENFVVPDRIAQYLAGLGNFTTNGENFELVMPDFDFSAGPGQQTGTLGGFVNTPAGRRVTPQTMWNYLHLPVPGILYAGMQREVDHIVGTANNVRFSLGSIRPTVASFPGSTTVNDTDNIFGWRRAIQDALHGSWDDTYNNIGIRASQVVNRLEIRPEVYSHWLINPLVIRWVSTRLQTLSNYKTVKTSSLTSKFGIYFQVSFLETPEYLVPPGGFVTIRDDYRAAAHTPVVLSSHLAQVAGNHLSPALACGYRYWIRFSTIQNVAGATYAAPWIPTAAANVIVTFPVASRVAANALFSTLPAEYSRRTYQTGHVERSALLHNILT